MSGKLLTLDQLLLMLVVVVPLFGVGKTAWAARGLHLGEKKPLKSYLRDMNLWAGSTYCSRW